MVPTPGHDGYPLAFAPINWTVSKDHFRNQVPKALDRPLAIFVALANLGYPLNRDFIPRGLALHEPRVSAADHPINWVGGLLAATEWSVSWVRSSKVLKNVMRDYQPTWRIRSRMSPL